MKADQFRTTTIRRGYVYSYYYESSAGGKPTILFLHGFPSTHRDWASQITYFAQKGYGIVAPDLLGYGKTSAPEDASEYKLQAIGQDVIDILNDLKVEKVIAIAHDWGCSLLSRMLNNYINYFSGAAFLALGYLSPQPNYDYKTVIAAFNQRYGYDIFGYWDFFAADDAVSLTEKNFKAQIDSFYSLLFPDDPLIWKTEMAPLRKAREWVEQNKQRPRAAFWTAEDKEAHKATLMQKGPRGAYNWYRAHHRALNNADEHAIPQERLNISIPTFLGGATKDYSCLIDAAKA
ncbi:Alpha/Beta hydrolase protein [Collybia nuda]|uniref:Alpha/Beta hydrolase protein n=1 Tax=Collybia nuda TaxID=64659 RepID=A0A9P5XYU7_9AGAR|nr:Alpha/Beta hydrolase protein [Collybia nuda]